MSPARPARSPAARRALIASLRAPARPAGPALESLVAACDPEELADLALSEGLAGPACAKLGALLPPEPRSRLATEARRDAVRHLAYLGLLSKLAAALDQAEVTWVALKGPVLAEFSYPDVPRSYADLDLLVSPGQLRAALGALEGAGAVVAEPDWPLAVAGAKGQLNLALHGLPLIDLHWHLVYLRSARERWAIPTEDLLGRRQRAQLKDVDAWTLDPGDFLAHLALHASFGAVQQLRRLLDIERTIASRAPDWDGLVRRCQAWRVGLPVSVTLSRARRTLGAAVPAEVVEELAGGRPNRLMVRQLSAWVPAGRMPGGRSVRNGLTRSLRDGLLATTREFAAGTGQAIAHGFRLRAAGAGERLDASAGLESYLEMVARADRYGHLGPASSPRADSARSSSR
ncbi:MAG: nucleotidyltransferase family protein [Streptosporangiaceae bacterium]